MLVVDTLVWRRTWPTSASPAPARSIWVAAVWRRRWAFTFARPARVHAARTIADTPPGLSRRCGARTRVNTSAHAADDALPMAPIDVGQLQCRHLPGPQPEADQQGQHREVPPAERAAPVTARQQAGDLRAAERRGQTRQAPSRHLRHRRLELALS